MATHRGQDLWEWEKRQEAALRAAPKIPDALTCPTCDSQWFERVQINKYKAEHFVILGQEIPAVTPGGIEYVMLKCVVCSDWMQPNILRNMGDPVDEGYNDLMDTLEGLKDSRLKEKKPDAVPSCVFGPQKGNLYIEELVHNTVDFTKDVYANFKFIEDDNFANDLANYAEEQGLLDIGMRMKEAIDTGVLKWTQVMEPGSRK
jgi:hypothetical protein